MKTTKWVGGLVVMGVLVLGRGALAEMITLYVPTDAKDASVLDNGAYGVTTTYQYCGWVNGHLYMPVEKFQIDPILAGKTITQATLWMRTISDSTLGVQVEHFTFDNTSDVNSLDGSTTQVENVGGPLQFANWAFYSWDVTAAVAADLTNGYSYTSYRINPVNSINPVNPTEGNYYAMFTDNSFYPSVRGYIEVTYVPEPVSLVLLAVGGLSWIWRRSL